MSLPTLEELEEVVYAINVEFHELTDCEYIYLTHSSNGFANTVELMGIPIWDSESDDREYLNLEEDDDTRVDIEAHIRQRMIEEIMKLFEFTLVKTEKKV